MTYPASDAGRIRLRHSGRCGHRDNDSVSFILLALLVHTLDTTRSRLASLSIIGPARVLGS